MALGIFGQYNYGFKIFLAHIAEKVHPRVKEMVIKAKDRDTVALEVSNMYSVRAIRNKFSKKYEELKKYGTSHENSRQLEVCIHSVAMVEGDVEFGTVCAGQVSAVVSAIQPARVIIQEIIANARHVLERLNQHST